MNDYLLNITFFSDEDDDTDEESITVLRQFDEDTTGNDKETK